MSKPKISTICVDTLTGLMDEMYMTSVGKPTHDQWKDWGQTIWGFNSALLELGFETILVIGHPGVGYLVGV